MPPDSTVSDMLTYREAANRALRRALTDDPRVIIYGEDVAKPGGVFGVTRGLHRDFGDRVFDTPISEAAILGSAVGAAMSGMLPVVEIMWADFSLVAFDQLVNQAANVRYTSAGVSSAPIVVRTQQGAAPGSCAQHSQCLEAMFLHVPGLRVVMPSAPQDAYDAILTAIDCPDPVIVIENRNLYPAAKAPVRTAAPVRDIGWHQCRRRGTDVTLVVWGALTSVALEAADVLGTEGIAVEILETPWLNPFPDDAVLASVAKTRRLVVAHEAARTGGFAAEVIARVAESGVQLVAPPQRVTAADIPIPAAPILANAVLPGQLNLVDAVHAVVETSPSGATGDLVISC